MYFLRKKKKWTFPEYGFVLLHKSVASPYHHKDREGIVSVFIWKKQNNQISDAKLV
jgi:hypothetical protein